MVGMIWVWVVSDRQDDLSVDLGCGWWPMDVLNFFGCWVVKREREREENGEENKDMGRREGDEINYFMG